MRILFVGMIDSIHTARWIEQVLDQGWDLHLFASQDGWLHPAFHDITVHDLYGQRHAAQASLKAWPWPLPRGRLIAKRLLAGETERWRQRALVRLIRRLKPDLVHSVEIQHAGYLALAARNEIGAGFPTWAVSNWGSDIYLFGQLREHRQRIRDVLRACDYYGCECERDVHLARRLGLEAPILPVVPNAGGFDLDRLDAMRSPTPPSARRTIVLKGYQGWAGRALFGLRAIEECADLLADYRIVLFSADEPVRLATQLLAGRTGLDIECLDAVPHEEILRLHGQARVSIGLSISDAISTSLLEAMAMGAFPIQSDTSCASEWIEDGKTGFLVKPEAVDQIADRLRRALREDALVDEGQARNDVTVRTRLCRDVVRPQVLEGYRTMLEASPGGRAPR